MSAFCSTQNIAPARVLLADDQPDVLHALSMLLEHEGCITEKVNGSCELLRALRHSTFDLVLMDLNYTRDTTSGAEGLDLISEIRKIEKDMPVAVMTAWSNVSLAVEAMQRGASDFVEKPWDNRALLRKVDALVEHSRELRRLQRSRLEEEQQAQSIHEHLLPRSLPKIPGYQIATWSRPVHFVGGDFYDVVQINEGETAICIADVAGKGIPAALLTSSLRAALRPLMSCKSPAELCGELNVMLRDIVPEGKFISFFYARLDHRRHVVQYCNAGHNPPILLRDSGEIERMESENAVLGHFLSWSYTQREQRMKPGDTLLIFTDGIIEACCPNGDEFGEDSLIAVCEKRRERCAYELLPSIVAHLSDFCAGDFQDDATMLVVSADRSSSLGFCPQPAD